MFDKKIEIAKEFVDLHCYGLGAWSPKWQLPSMSDEAALLEIYYNLVGGEYGNTENNGMGELTIEIDSHASMSGCPLLFEFPILSAELTNEEAQQ